MPPSWGEARPPGDCGSRWDNQKSRSGLILAPEFVQIVNDLAVRSCDLAKHHLVDPKEDSLSYLLILPTGFPGLLMHPDVGTVVEWKGNLILEHLLDRVRTFSAAPKIGAVLLGRLYFVSGMIWNIRTPRVLSWRHLIIRHP